MNTPGQHGWWWRNTALAVLALIHVGVGPVAAQSIRLNAPLSPTNVPDADDFASEEVGNAWDMDRLRDLPYDAGYGQSLAAGGVWGATSISSTCYFFPLSPGFVDPDPRYPFHSTYYTEGTPYGPLNPIDASRYRRLSFRLAQQQSVRSYVHIGWSTDRNVWPSSVVPVDRVGRLWFADQEPTFAAGGAPVMVRNPSGWRMYDVDLSGSTWGQERISWLTLACTTYGRPWGGSVQGLMIQPFSDPVAPGAAVQVDWIRLYDPDTSPRVDLTWQTSGFSWDNWHSIRLYVDRDAAGFDGDLLQTGIANDGRYTLLTGGLPPGDYYVYLQVVRHENSGFRVVATSGYSGRIRVGNTPYLEFQSPSFTSGVDYATTELGNAWDFNASDDHGTVRNIGSIQFAGGVMEGVGLASGGVSDPQIFLNMRRNGVKIPIDTAKYRYLTFRIRSDNAGSVNLVDRAARGWETKLTWWNQSLSRDGTYTRAINLLEGWRSYSLDLWDQRLCDYRYPYTTGWTAIPQVNELRLDPLETPISTRFWLDDVKLCAQNAPELGAYEVRWTLADPDSTAVTVRVYYGYYNVAGYQEQPTPIYEGVHGPGSGSFVWDTRSLRNDSYYLRSVVSDGVNESSSLAEVPVVVTGALPRFNIAGHDLAVFNGARTGLWQILLATGSVATANWGWSSVEPLADDYDGDGADDLAVFDQASGRWYIQSAQKAVILSDANWGWPGVVPVTGDYNGDGRADLAVFDRNTGRWFIREVAGDVLAMSENWGWPNVDPVPGDYDGDGVDDLAIFDQSTGRWFIRTLAGPVLGWSIYWGWPGVRPVPGDFDGDGRDDLAIYDLNTGRWFIRSLAGAVIKWEDYWGFKGAVPVPGDYDQDGRADQVVYHESAAQWYFKLSGGVTDAGGPWGGPGFKAVSGNFDGQ
jgi:hypothetical protein